MKIRKRFFSVFLSTLLFTGCAVNSAADNSNSMRAWFQALPWYGKVLSLGILYALILFLISRYIGAAITPAARNGLRHKRHLQEKPESHVFDRNTVRGFGFLCCMGL